MAYKDILLRFNKFSFILSLMLIILILYSLTDMFISPE